MKYIWTLLEIEPNLLAKTITTFLITFSLIGIKYIISYIVIFYKVISQTFKTITNLEIKIIKVIMKYLLIPIEVLFYYFTIIMKNLIPLIEVLLVFYIIISRCFIICYNVIIKINNINWYDVIIKVYESIIAYSIIFYMQLGFTLLIYAFTLLIYAFTLLIHAIKYLFTFLMAIIKHCIVFYIVNSRIIFNFFIFCFKVFFVLFLQDYYKKLKYVIYFYLLPELIEVVDSIKSKATIALFLIIVYDILEIAKQTYPLIFCLVIYFSSLMFKLALIGLLFYGLIIMFGLIIGVIVIKPTTSVPAGRLGSLYYNIIPEIQILLMGIINCTILVINSLVYVINQFSASEWITKFQAIIIIIIDYPILNYLCLVTFVVLSIKYWGVFILIIFYVLWVSEAKEKEGLVPVADSIEIYTFQNMNMVFCFIVGIVYVLYSVFVPSSFISCYILELLYYIMLLIIIGLQLVKGLVNIDLNCIVEALTLTVEDRRFINSCFSSFTNPLNSMFATISIYLSFGSTENWEGYTGVTLSLNQVISISIFSGDLYNFCLINTYEMFSFCPYGLVGQITIFGDPIIEMGNLMNTFNFPESITVSKPLLTPTTLNCYLIPNYNFYFPVKFYSTCSHKADISNLEFIPYTDTTMLKRFRVNVLHDILDKLGPHNNLVIWLKIHTAHLLDDPTGKFTNIPTNSVKLSTLLQGKSLNAEFTSSIHSTKTGVYVVTDPFGNLYVGSALNFRDRWTCRYSKFNKEKWFINTDRTTLKYTELAYTTNYNALFFSHFPLKLSGLNENHKNDYCIILRLFTEYEERLVEQAVISYTIPSLNTYKIVNIASTYNLSNLKNNIRPVFVKFLTSNTFISFPSVSEASAVTGVNKRNLKNALNYVNLGNRIISPIFNEPITYLDAQGTLPHIFYKPPSILRYPGIPYEKIPTGKIWVFNDENTHIASFNSIQEIAVFYNLEQKNISNYADYKFIFVPSVNTRLLFARNLDYVPKNTKVIVIVHNTKTGIYYSYSSLRSAAVALSTYLDTVKRNIDTTRLFGDYQVYSLENALHVSSEKGPTCLIAEDLSPEAYVVDISTDPFTVLSFEFRSLAALYVSNNEHYRNSPNHVFKPYGDNNLLYKGRYFLYTKGKLPAEYASLVGETITRKNYKVMCDKLQL